MQVGMYLSGFQYFTCPIEYDPVTYARITECPLNPAFQLTDYHIPLPYALVSCTTNAYIPSLPTGVDKELAFH